MAGRIKAAAFNGRRYVLAELTVGACNQYLYRFPPFLTFFWKKESKTKKTNMGRLTLPLNTGYAPRIAPKKI